MTRAMNRAMNAKSARGVAALAALLALSACGGGRSAGDGGGGGSRWNPVTWITSPLSSRAPKTLEPEGGYGKVDARTPVAQILSARWEPLNEGRLLVVTAIAPTKGWHDAALVNQTSQPAGRIVPDADGVLRLQLLASPPPEGSADAARAAQPGADTITAAMPISTVELRSIGSVTVSGGLNGITLQR